MTPTNLGEEMQVLTIAVKDYLSEAGAVRLHDLLIRKIRMTKVCNPHVWVYPVHGNIGGIGETIVQPFGYAQPLAESITVNLPGLSITDSWHEHQGFYLIICSCRPFGVESLIRWLFKRGWKVIDYKVSHVSIKKAIPWWKRLFHWF